MSLTGWLWNDADGDGATDGIPPPDSDPRLGGVTIIIQAWDGVNGVVTGPILSSCVTASDGSWNMPDGMLVFDHPYAIQALLGEEWTQKGPFSFSYVSGDVVAIPASYSCTYTPTSQWVYKICYINKVNTDTGQTIVQGVKVTFKDHMGLKGKIGVPKPKKPGKAKKPKHAKVTKQGHMHQSMSSAKHAAKNPKKAPNLLKQILKLAKQKHGKQHTNHLTVTGSGMLFTVLYPGTQMTDYLAMVAAASRGKWIHQFYDKKRMYIPWPTIP